MRRATSRLQIKADRRSIMELKDLLGENYKDGMTIEEINTALANKKFVDLSGGGYVSIDKFKATEKVATDAKAELEKIRQASMSEEEKRQEEWNALQAQLDILTKENQKNAFEKKLLANGYDAEETQQIMANPDDPAIYAQIMKARIEKTVAQNNAENLKNSVKLPQTSPDGKPKKLTEYSMRELNEIRDSNPALYRQILNQK